MTVMVSLAARVVRQFSCGRYHCVWAASAITRSVARSADRSLFHSIPPSLASSSGSVNNSSLKETPAPALSSVETALTKIRSTKSSDAGAASDRTLHPGIFDEFALTDRVAIVSGANRGLGLEMALALSELGARAVYALDLPKTPSEEFEGVKEYVGKLEGPVQRRLEYISVDVTKQKQVWEAAKTVGDKEGRLDACVAAAGILDTQDCLEYTDTAFEKMMDVNCNGVFYTAQAAGQQMKRFGNGGSIVLIASMSGSITNRSHKWVGYNTSKSALLQMARSMACELGQDRIRVNTLSPGHIYTKMTAAFLDKQPELGDVWANSNPLGRLGRPEELRGVIAWLASDASTFCTGSDILVSGGHHAW